MITFVSARLDHVPHKALLEFPGVPEISLKTYDAVLGARRASRSTYVFMDFDRLSPWDLELAATLYRELQVQGVRVLNDPARACQRSDMLRKLHRRGINGFNAWRAEDEEVPDRYPVFVRTASAHRGVATELLHSAQEVQLEIGRLLDAGHPRKDLIIVEYAAQPLETGVFRKLAAFRVGDRIVPALSVHETHWAAKHGTLNAAREEDYEDEFRLIRDNPYERELMAAFQIAEIDYGRADYTLINGRPQVYEINTNPSIGSVKEHAFQRRFDSDNLYREGYIAALHAIDTPKTAAVRLQNRKLRKQRRRDGLFIRSRCAD